MLFAVKTTLASASAVGWTMHFGTPISFFPLAVARFFWNSLHFHFRSYYIVAITLLHCWKCQMLIKKRKFHLCRLVDLIRFIRYNWCVVFFFFNESVSQNSTVFIRASSLAHAVPALKSNKHSQNHFLDQNTNCKLKNEYSSQFVKCFNGSAHCFEFQSEFSGPNNEE